MNLATYCIIGYVILNNLFAVKSTNLQEVLTQEKREQEESTEVEIPFEKERPKKWITIEAALSSGGKDATARLYFYAGDMIHILYERKPERIVPKERYSALSNMHLQAAFYNGNRTKVSHIYYGDKYAVHIKYTNKGPVARRLRYGPKRAFIRNGGPDAVGRRSGQVYVFKGCQMVIRKAWNKWGKPKDMKAVGLPCPIDAAWKEDDDMMVLIGDQFWRWAGDDDEGGVSGPFAFDEKYTLGGDWAVKPASQEEL